MRRQILIILLTTLIASISCSKDKDVQTKPLESQLLEATKKNNAEMVRALLKQKVKIDEKDSQGRTALLIATRNNDVEIAKLLIEAGADVNIQDQIQDSPLLYAGAEGRLEILKMILKSKPNFKIYNRFGGTALIPAAEKGHVEVVKELVKTPIDINHVNNLGWTALMEAVVLSDGGPVHQQIIQILVDAGANVNIPDRDKVTALTHAKKKGFKEIVAILEKAGAR
nr:ankyrin repeat domain-containing protein [Bdellovibrio sp. CKG001]